MKNSYIIIILFYSLIGKCLAQTTEWTVNENNFQYTMSFVAFLNIEGINLNNPNDKVACFVNGECRGVANLTYVESEDSYYAYLTAFANENNETLNFKIYNSEKNEIVDVDRTQTFEINEHKGDLFQSFSIANPTLSKNANILDFSFKGITINDQIVNDYEITLYLDNGINRAALIPIFELSPDASLYLGDVEIDSESIPIDFSKPVVFDVLSSDRSDLVSWTINVISSVGTVKYYKKDAVCYQGGAIKVATSENETEISLFKNDQVYSVHSIDNGEAIFTDLEMGIYRIVIGGNVKEISINLKE